MWTVEASSTPGLYDIYDEDGNRVVRHTTHERAALIAAVPDLLAALHPFAALYSKRFDDLGDDVPLYQHGDALITVGDVRRAKDAVAGARGGG